MPLIALLTISNTNALSLSSRPTIPLSSMLSIILLNLSPTASPLGSLGSILSLISDNNDSGDFNNACMNCSFFTSGSLGSASAGNLFAMLYCAELLLGSKKLTFFGSALGSNSIGDSSLI